MRWERRKKSDPVAVALANRHYSRVKYGTVGKLVGPPGRLLTFVTEDGNAVWVSHWPYAELALDKLDAWRCTLFRNEGLSLSSDLIRSAMAETYALWYEQGVPDGGWITWVDVDEIHSSNPGYCFKVAGWKQDREWKSTRKNVNLIRLRAEVTDA